MKKNLYIIFEKIPSLKTGGLIATYVRLVPILIERYNVKIVSVFESNNEDNLFEGCEIITLSKKNIDLDFPKMFKELKQFHFLEFFKKIYHLLYFFTSILFLRKKMESVLTKSDLVIATCPVAAMFMPKNVPFILEIHIYYEYFFGGNFLGSMQSKFMQTPSLTLFRTKCDAEKASGVLNASYVYNFLDNKEIEPSKKLVPKKICYVGRLSEQKNPLQLIENAKNLKEIIPDFILDIYGTGHFETEMKEKILEYNLSENVFMKGFINDKNIYKNYSCLWNTSTFEGLSLTMIEAKANGIPIITTFCGDGIYEVIHSGKDGYIANNKDDFIKKTVLVLTDKKIQKELSKNSLQDFKRFSKEQAKENWFQLLDNFEKDFIKKEDN